MPEEATLEEQVKSVINEFRPITQQHGGDVEFVNLDDQRIVYVRLRGACAGCPSATATLKLGLEQFLRAKVPSVGGVEQVQ